MGSNSALHPADSVAVPRARTYNISCKLCEGLPRGGLPLWRYVEQPTRAVGQAFWPPGAGQLQQELTRTVCLCKCTVCISERSTMLHKVAIGSWLVHCDVPLFLYGGSESSYFLACLHSACIEILCLTLSMDLLHSAKLSLDSTTRQLGLQQTTGHGSMLRPWTLG